MDNTDNKPLALSAFGFGGGFALGMRNHFKVPLDLEEADVHTQVATKNLKDYEVIIGADVWDEALAAFKRIHGMPEIVFGNPPCAAWSSMGKSAGTAWRTSPLINCTQRHFSLLEKLQPKVFVWESVVNAFTHGREFVDELANRARALGYTVTCVLHDAKLLGVPQERKRFFFVAHKVKVNWRLPGLPLITVKEAIEGVPVEPPQVDLVKTDWGRWLMRDVLPKVPPGGRLRAYATMEEVQASKPKTNGSGLPSFNMARERLNSPSFAVVSATILHPLEDRGLTGTEYKRLMGYPDTWELPNGVKGVLAMTQGVCPPVASWLGGLLAEALRENVPLTEANMWLWDGRRDPATWDRLKDSWNNEVPVAIQNPGPGNIVDCDVIEESAPLRESFFKSELARTGAECNSGCASTNHFPATDDIPKDFLDAADRARERLAQKDEETDIRKSFMNVETGELLTSTWANREYKRLLLSLMTALKAAPRGKLVRELLAHQSVVPMTDSCVNIISRKVSDKFRYAEAAWILSGDNRVSTISKFNKRIAQYSDDGLRFFGAYGPKVIDQLSYVAQCLSKDRESRQAVINIWRENPRETKDVPCTLSLQFVIRNGELHCIATMRSSDAWLGWPYDVFNFSMIAKAVLIELNAINPETVKIKLGNLFLTAGSQHLYEEHWAAAEEVINDEHETYSPQIPSFSSIGQLVEWLGWQARIAAEAK